MEAKTGLRQQLLDAAKEAARTAALSPARRSRREPPTPMLPDRLPWLKPAAAGKWQAPYQPEENPKIIFPLIARAWVLFRILSK
jgi:hypothetical protein